MIYLILFIIIVFTYIHYLINLKDFEKINYIINPSDYEVIRFCDEYYKFDSTNEMLGNLNVNNELLSLLKDIRFSINKELTYGIKLKDNKYRLEIYLYGKPLTINNNTLDTDINELINNTIKILKILNFKLDENTVINKLIETSKSNDLFLISFDININDPYYNNKLHLYTRNFKLNKFFTIEYDLINNNIVSESFFIKIKNYELLKEYLLNFKDIKIKCNIDNIIQELKEISSNNNGIIFHHKYYNNSIGFYLCDSSFDDLDKFLKKYNYKKLYDNENLFKKLSFDLVVNYSLDSCTINGTGFFDIF